MEQGREPANSSHTYVTPSLGIEPGPHWCEASVLTIASSLTLSNQGYISGVGPFSLDLLNVACV